MIGVQFDEIDGNAELPVERYAIIALAGHPTEIPGDLIGVTMWDGVSEWTPPDYTVAELYDPARHHASVRPIPVPDQVDNFQVRALLMGIPGSAPGCTLFQDVDAMLKAEGGVSLQAWEYSNKVSRTGALVHAMATRLGIGEAGLDDMFRRAAAITA